MTAPARKKRSLLDLGVSLLALTVLWFLAFVVAIILLGVGLTVDSNAIQLGLTLMIFVAPAGYWLWRRYSAFFDVARESALRLPNPVLFLRPFSKDDRKIESGFESVGWSVALGPLGRVWYATLLRKTPEERIEQATMKALGPMVALGSPRDRMPRSGALRVYASDGEWQDVVRVFVSRAQAVFMMAGTTTALTWELGHLRETVEPSRVFIFTEPPNTIRDRWSAILRTFEAAGWVLPARDPGPGAVIGFDDAWQPAVLARGADDAERLIAAVMKWRDASERAICPGCESSLIAAECASCLDTLATNEGAVSPEHPEALPIATEARGLIGERRPSDDFLGWILPLLGRFRFRGFRVAWALLVLTAVTVLSIVTSDRPPLPQPAWFLVLLVSAALLLALAMWTLRRAPVRTVERKARKQGFSATAVEHLGTVVDRRAALIGAESGTNLGSAILLEAPFASMIPALEDRAIRSRLGTVTEVVRNRETLGGVAYDIVDAIQENGSRKRLHFELHRLDVAARAEEIVRAEPRGEEFLREVVVPAIPVIRQRASRAPGSRVSLWLATLAAVASLAASVIGGFLVIVTEEPDALRSAYLWALPVTLLAPAFLLLCRRLRRGYAIEWRHGGEALLDLQSNVRPSDANSGAIALIVVGAIVVLIVVVVVGTDLNARQKLWQELERERKTAAASLIAADIARFHEQNSALSARLADAIGGNRIDADDARVRRAQWETDTRSLLVSRFDEVLAKSLARRGEAERLEALLRTLNLRDHAARVNAALQQQRERFAKRGLHVTLVAGDELSSIDAHSLEMLARPFLAELREELNAQYDIIQRPGADEETYAVAIEVRIDADLFRFGPALWTGDPNGPPADAPPEVRRRFAAIPITVRYTTSVIHGKAPHVEAWDFDLGTYPRSNPRLDALGEETTESTEWTIDDARAAEARNLELLEEELDLHAGT
jgi:hypothetical protein